MKTIERLVALILATTWLLPIGRALALDMTPELQAVVNGAKTEGTLRIEAPPTMMGGQDIVNAASAWMKREFGLDVKVAWNPNYSFTRLLAKINSENVAGQAASSDAFVGTVKQVGPVLDKGIFKQVPWEKLLPGRITRGIVEGDDRALRVASYIPGVLYNKKLLPQIASVTTMEDLLKPEFTGKLSLNPDLAGLDVLAANWGRPRTIDYIHKLAKQGGVAPCGSGERIASGELLALVLDCAGLEQNYPKFRDVLGLHVVPDAAQRRYNYLTIPANAAGWNIGILYGVYLSTPEGQKFMHDATGDELVNYPESSQAAVVTALEQKGIHLTEVTLQWGAEHQADTEMADQLAKDLGKL